MKKKLYFYYVLMWQLTWSRQKLWHHVAAYENATCLTHVHMRACAGVRVCVCVINENKHPFQEFLYLINDTILLYPLIHHNFRHAGLFSSFFMRR